jgi:hypothetical protein
MRVAVCGTHGVGKSTLIEAFVRRHADYVVEPEAYEALQDLYGEVFAAEPSADEFSRQLDYHIGRLREYDAGDRVVFERSPADYVAYMLALEDLSRDTADARLAERAIAIAREAMAMLDVVVYLPGAGGGPETEDPQLRRAVDARLEGILVDDELDLFEGRRPFVVEAYGSTAQRLRALEAALR